MEANLFNALSHPVRIQILLHLAITRTCLQGNSSDLFPLGRTTINQHINELEEAELIKDHSVDGKTVYCLNLA
jgi:DNA-binding transcriptional ArsR family regulator